MNPPQLYMSSQSWNPLPSPSPDHLSGSSQCTSPRHPVSCVEPRLAIRFLHASIHVSMPFSQIIPPSPSPTESTSLFCTSASLLLFSLVIWWLSFMLCLDSFFSPVCLSSLDFFICGHHEVSIQQFPCFPGCFKFLISLFQTHFQYPAFERHVLLYALAVQMSQQIFFFSLQNKRHLGLPWWSNGYTFPVQGVWVRFLVRELDPICHN